VAELKEGRVRAFTVQPEQFGLKRGDMSKLAVTSPAESLKMIESVLNNDAGPARDIVAFNAGAAIYVAGLAPDLGAGIETAQAVIASGAAKKKLHDLVALSRKLAAA
jgi:anthranilate phosphoribosyltransferase